MIILGGNMVKIGVVYQNDSENRCKKDLWISLDQENKEVVLEVEVSKDLLGGVDVKRVDIKLGEEDIKRLVDVLQGVCRDLEKKEV